MRPLILCAGSRRYEPAREHFLPMRYVGAIEKCGSCGVLSLEGTAAEHIGRFDGLLLCGGNDINPALYGEERFNSTVEWDDARDAAELALFNAFFSAKKPIFGICRGHQVINVALGGSLWQDLPGQCGLEHSGTNHNAAIEHGSFLYELFGAAAIVNSYHHQAVKRLGDGLRAAAYSPDGIIEGLCHEDAPLLSVQWHPEHTVPVCPGELTPMEKLFAFFIGKCI